MPINPEVALQSQSQLDQLRTARHQEAERVAAQDLQKKVSAMDRAGAAHGWLAYLKNTYMPSDNGNSDAHDLMVLSAFDIEPAGSFDKDGVMTQSSVALVSGNEVVTLEPYSTGFTASLRIDGQSAGVDEVPSKATAIQQKVMDRYAQSPQYTAINALNTKLKSGTYGTEIATEPFDISQDRVATLALLNDLELSSAANNQQATTLLDKNMPFDEFLNQAIGAAEYRWQKVENEDGSITYKPNPNHKASVHTTVAIDAEKGTAQLTFSSDVANLYSEKANQSDQSESVPFIETECAAQLFSALDSQGLMVNPRIQREIVAVTDLNDRYGSIYSEMTRTIAKWINDPNRTNLGELFVPRDDQLLGLTDKWTAESYQPPVDPESVAHIEQGIMNVDLEGLDEPARHLFQMAQQVIARTESDVAQSALPVETGEIRLRMGACFDVAAYYLAAAESRHEPLKGTVINGVHMLEKTRGAHTFLTTEAMQFNGVTVPKGALMARSDKNAWSVLRLTPFTFDQPKDQLATGSEIAKAVEAYSRFGRAAGHLTLNHLQQNAR